MATQDRTPREMLVFAASLALFILSAAKSLNIYDLFTYADDLEKSFEKGDFLYPLFHSFGPYGGGKIDSAFSRSSMYVAVSSPVAWFFSHKLGMDIEFVLNALSAFLVAVSSVFVYKTARLFLDETKSVSAWAVYIIMPYVFFNAINASAWPLQLLLSSAWLYFLSSSMKNKNEKDGFIATAALLAGIFTYLSSITLVIAHFYGLSKVKNGLPWLWKNALVLSPAAVLAYYFTAVTPVYPFSFDALRYSFMFLLLVWEAANALSAGLFFAVALAFYGMVRKARRNRLDNMEKLFLLSFLPTFSGLSVFVYNPIFIFNAIFVFLPLVAVRGLQKYKKFGVLIILILVLAALKSSPIYSNFHLNNHPHKDFAMWLNSALSQDSTVVVGHECPAVKYYTKLSVVCRGEVVNISSGKVYVTSQYFRNENQLELEYMNDYAKKTFGFRPFGSVESYITRYDVLGGAKTVKTASYDGAIRGMEDSYEIFFSFYPDPLRNLLSNTEFPKVRYELFQVMQ